MALTPAQLALPQDEGHADGTPHELQQTLCLPSQNDTAAVEHALQITAVGLSKVQHADPRINICQLQW